MLPMLYSGVVHSLLFAQALSRQVALTRGRVCCLPIACSHVLVGLSCTKHICSDGLPGSLAVYGLNIQPAWENLALALCLSCALSLFCHVCSSNVESMWVAHTTVYNRLVVDCLRCMSWLFTSLPFSRTAAEITQAMLSPAVPHRDCRPS